MIRLPRWFPEIDVLLQVMPLIYVEVCASRYDAYRRHFIITRMQIGLLRWRGAWLYYFGFDIYKREI